MTDAPTQSINSQPPPEGVATHTDGMEAHSSITSVYGRLCDGAYIAYFSREDHPQPDRGHPADPLERLLEEDSRWLRTQRSEARRHRKSYSRPHRLDKPSSRLGLEDGGQSSRRTGATSTTPSAPAYERPGGTPRFEIFDKKKHGLRRPAKTIEDLVEPPRPKELPDSAPGSDALPESEW